MKSKKKIIIVVSLIIVAGMIVVAANRIIESRKPFRIYGFYVERSVMDRKLTIKDIKNLEYGTSFQEIYEQLGEPDDYIGEGNIRVVYFLKDGRAVVFYFEKQPFSAPDNGLVGFEVFSKSGKYYAFKAKTKDEE